MILSPISAKTSEFEKQAIQLLNFAARNSNFVIDLD